MTIKRVGSADDLQTGLVKSVLGNKEGKPNTNPMQILGDGNAEQKIEVGLSRLINSELSPAALEAERKAKVEKLKELVAAGKYKPSSEDVALALGQEIAYEIMSAPKDRN